MKFLAKLQKIILEDMFSSGKTARQIVDEKGLQQVTDQGEIAKLLMRSLQKIQKWSNSI